MREKIELINKLKGSFWLYPFYYLVVFFKYGNVETAIEDARRMEGLERAAAKLIEDRQRLEAKSFGDMKTPAPIEAGKKIRSSYGADWENNIGMCVPPSQRNNPDYNKGVLDLDAIREEQKFVTDEYMNIVIDPRRVDANGELLLDENLSPSTPFGGAEPSEYQGAGAGGNWEDGSNFDSMINPIAGNELTPLASQPMSEEFHYKGTDNTQSDSNPQDFSVTYADDIGSRHFVPVPKENPCAEIATFYGGNNDATTSSSSPTYESSSSSYDSSSSSSSSDSGSSSGGDSGGGCGGGD